MKIKEICDLLKQELYENGYQYGFYSEGRKYTPDFSNGFDVEYFNLSKTIYRIQNPSDTMRVKIGTCIDAVMVMKTILDKTHVPYKIWLIHHRVKKNEHTLFTFEVDGKLVYLELTPQSNKPWYGKEILYNNEQSFINEFQKENYVMVDVTNKITIGDTPDSLLHLLKNSM